MGAWRDRRLSELELTVRAATCLADAGFKTLGEVADKTDEELLTIPLFGQVQLDCVRSLQNWNENPFTPKGTGFSHADAIERRVHRLRIELANAELEWLRVREEARRHPPLNTKEGE